MDRSDWSDRANEPVGRLCWFCEPHGIRFVVRVIAAWVSGDGERMNARIHLLASGGWHKASPGVGATCVVSTEIGPGRSAYGWRLYPLDAATLECAIAEIAAEESSVPYDGWQRMPTALS